MPKTKYTIQHHELNKNSEHKQVQQRHHVKAITLHNIRHHVSKDTWQITSENARITYPKIAVSNPSNLDDCI